MQLPTALSRESVYQNPYFKVVQEKRSLGEKAMEDYYTLELADAVMALAWSDEGRLLVCHEWRQSASQWVLGLPGGRLNEGESPLDGAKRELLEETGVAGEDWIFAGSFYPFVGMTSQRIHVWSARACRVAQEPCLEPGEFIRRFWLTPSELRQKLREGYLLDGILASCLWLLEEKRALSS